jgi:hypothetical protein
MYIYIYTYMLVLVLLFDLRIRSFQRKLICLYGVETYLSSALKDDTFRMYEYVGGGGV